MSLLRADLRSLLNLPRDPGGRRMLVHVGSGLVLLCFLSWWIADNLLGHPELLRLMQRRGVDSLQGMLGLGLMPCPIAATWLGLSAAQRQLFESPELPLWQSAPMPAWRGAVQILLRAAGFALVWSAALALPFVLTVLAHTPAGFAAFAIAPVAVATATLPLMATLLVVQIALVRLFAGRVLRIVLTFLGAAASVGFSTWLLVVLFTGGERADRLVTAAGTPDSLPWTVDAGTHTLVSLASGDLDLAALRSCGWWLLLAATLFWIGARLHPRALEAHRLATPPVRRRRTSWPTGLVATVRRKEIAQLLQQPGALIGFLIFAFLVFALVEKQVLVGSIHADWRLPLQVRQVGAMLAHWFLATVLVLYPHMGRIVLWDGAQWSLYQSAPPAAAAILRGKLEAIGLMLLWPLLLVAGVSAHAGATTPRALIVFATLALPGLLTALGVLAFVGTLPWLVRPDESRQLAQGGRNFFASLLLITLFELAMTPVMFGWLQLSAWAQVHELDAELVHEWTPRVIAAAWAYGLVVLGLGLATGARNFRKLLRPL